MDSLKIVYTLWTKPLTELNDSLGFNSLEAFMDSLILSVNVSKQNYDDVQFYTDNYGMELIKPYMDQLPFSKIHNILDELNWLPSQWWAYPKIHVYSLQDKPFIHIDNDAYLWNGIPEKYISNNDVICQSLEDLEDGGYWFYKDGVRVYDKHILENMKDVSHYKFAMNAGVFGAFNKKGINMFKELSKNAKKVAETVLKDKYLLDFIDWKDLRNWDAFLYNVLMEQYYPYTYCIDNGLNVLRLLETDLPFTHLISAAKRDNKKMEKVKKRVNLKIWNLENVEKQYKNNTYPLDQATL